LASSAIATNLCRIQGVHRSGIERKNAVPLMQEASTKRIYDIHSLFYDATFGRLVKKRIQRAIEHMNIRDSDLVLDLGIGTGVSLNFYPQHARLVGLDLSAGMLREARKKIAFRGMDHATVFQGDALYLPFADSTFDHVFISHVISVVSDPYRLVREAQRIAKPDARIVIVNHFQSTNRAIALVEKWLCPLCTKLGWRSDLPLNDLVRRTGMQVDYRFKLDSIDLWETVVINNDKSSLGLPILAT
jgi:phosphatidylethanolamine/phosphatidyl-N-methylethanolamine N-methyltransferase